MKTSKPRQVRRGTKTALDHKVERLFTEKGYWTATGYFDTDLGRATCAFKDIDFDRLRASIEKDERIIITDTFWTPPADDFDLEQDHISRLLDDEEFLSTGNFRNPAYGNIEDFTR